MATRPWDRWRTQARATVRRARAALAGAIAPPPERASAFSATEWSSGDHGGAENPAPPPAGGPPAYWLERVRRGAPHLLQPGPAARVAPEDVASGGRAPGGPAGRSRSAGAIDEPRRSPGDSGAPSPFPAGAWSSYDQGHAENPAGPSPARAAPFSAGERSPYDQGHAENPAGPSPARAAPFSAGERSPDDQRPAENAASGGRAISVPRGRRRDVVLRWPRRGSRPATGDGAGPAGATVPPTPSSPVLRAGDTESSVSASSPPEGTSRGRTDAARSAVFLRWAGRARSTRPPAERRPADPNPDGTTPAPTSPELAPRAAAVDGPAAPAREQALRPGMRSAAPPPVSFPSAPRRPRADPVWPLGSPSAVAVPEPASPTPASRTAPPATASYLDVRRWPELPPEPDPPADEATVAWLDARLAAHERSEWLRREHERGV